MEPHIIFMVNFGYAFFLSLWWMAHNVTDAIRTIHDIIDDL